MERPDFFIATCHPMLRAYVEHLEARLRADGNSGSLPRESDSQAVRALPDADASSRLESEPDRNQLGGFSRTSSTSRAAALDNYPRSGTQRWTCLLAVAKAGERGLTSEEIAGRFNMHLPSVKPRLTELKEGEWVEVRGTRTGAMGSEVDVYVLSAVGRRRLEERATPGLPPDWNRGPQPPEIPPEPERERLW